MSADLPTEFIQTKMSDIENGEEHVIMKITGVLVDLLVKRAPEVYRPYVLFENSIKVLYVQVFISLYGMFIASVKWYKQL